MKSLRNGVLVDMTAEEVTAREAEEAANLAKIQSEQDAKTAKEAEDAEAKSANDALKASAKTKLMAGEALTEAEADTIVI
tara:strand:- start:96 stop:335 length:240 start_codon:yes stop_codon:yes gene_type:complete